MILETDWHPGRNSDRRRHGRLAMAGAAARLDAMGGCGLCILLDLSDGGAQIQTPIALRFGDPVRISFDCTNAMQGRVVWNCGNKAGIQFLAPVVLSTLIRKVATDRWNRTSRAPRLPVNGPALATTEAGSYSTVVYDISQEGMRIWNAGDLRPGSAVDVVMSDAVRVHGTVRWSAGICAGIQLSGRLTVGQLANARQL